MGTRWRGMLAPIDAPTGDGRRIAAGGFTNRPLPLPLKWQRVDANGHDTSVVVGSLERIDIDEDGEIPAVWGEGELFDDVSPATNPRLAEDVGEAKILLERKVIGPSVDPGSAQGMTVIKGTDRALDDQGVERYYAQHGAMPETEVLFTGYEIAAATLVPIPAFAECRPFQLLDASGAPAPAREAILAACAALPPLDPELFANPNLATYTPLTRRPLGNGWTHVFGHVGTHDVCHVGLRGVCTTMPYSEQEYQPFHRYSNTRDGHALPVVAGRLTAGFGKFENMCRCHPGNDDHACGNLSLGGAIAHHDRMETLAYVCAGEDEANNAVWYSGVEAPECSSRGRELMSNRRTVSGDWREHGPGYELTEVLVLARRNPGFPLPRVSMQNGRQRSLTAAGVITPERAVSMAAVGADTSAGAPVADVMGAIDYDRLGDAVARALLAAAESEAAAALTAAVRSTGWDSMPVAPEGHPWDKGAAVRRLVDWADGDISGEYARAFLWRDADGDPDLQGTYKFPLADVIDGELTVVPNAVRNALSRLDSADIPAADRERMHGVLERLLGDVNEEDDGPSGDMAFDRRQKRGSDGKWISMGGGFSSPRGGAPQRLSTAEFEREVPQSHRFYRGVTNADGAEATRQGALGGGDYGKGIYMDPRIGTAQNYSYTGPQDTGAIIRMGLRPGVKIKTIPERVKAGGSAAIDKWAEEGDYDVIGLGNGTYTIVRNPAVLIVDDRDFTRRESTILERLQQGYDMPKGYEAEISALRRDLGIAIPDAAMSLDGDGAQMAYTAAAPDSYDGAMIALRMTDADAARLAVTDGLPMDDLHMTLAYLGRADAITPEARDRMVKSMGRIAKKLGGPITADGFSVSAFNPGTANDRDTAIVMGVSGATLADVQQGVCRALGNCEGYEMPEQHSPWVAHTTLTYDDDLSKVGAYADRVGPITFDRLRLAFGGENIDIPLGEIIEDDEADQERRDEDGAMYAARAERATRLAAEIRFAVRVDRSARAAAAADRLTYAALNAV